MGCECVYQVQHGILLWMVIFQSPTDKYHVADYLQLFAYGSLDAFCEPAKGEAYDASEMAYDRPTSDTLEEFVMHSS